MLFLLLPESRGVLVLEGTLLFDEGVSTDVLIDSLLEVLIDGSDLIPVDEESFIQELVLFSSLGFLILVGTLLVVILVYIGYIYIYIIP
jgi:hypothetical protein